MLTKAMAVDLVGHGIRVNALAPGLTNTGMSELSTEEGRAFRRKVLTRIPMGRPAEPEEMVGAAIFLASDEANYVTGASLVVDRQDRPQTAEITLKRVFYGGLRSVVCGLVARVGRLVASDTRW